MANNTYKDFKNWVIGATVGYLILMAGGIISIHETNQAADQSKRLAKSTRILQSQQVAQLHATDAALKKVVTESCEVQVRGLTAQKYLIGSLREIRTILSPLPGEKIVKQPAAVEEHLDSLRSNLDHYLRIQKQQPKNRQC